jgi:nucleotide-binding universal stress UspA family protein
MGVVYVMEGGNANEGCLDEARRALTGRGIESTPFALTGDPARTICMAAERQGYDTIVVGRRNILDAGLLLLGSVAARVVAGAPGDVVVVA